MTPATPIAVIIPAHNAAATIAETVASLAAQTDKRFVAVVCDDGSSDTTYDEAHLALARHGLAGHIVRRASPGGPAVARNAAIRAVRADWYVMLDADDLAHPFRIESIRQAVLSCHGCAMVYHPATHREPDGSERVIDPGPPPLDLARGNPLTASAVAFSRAAWDRAGGFNEEPDLRGVEDWAMWLAVLTEGGAAYVPQSLTTYRAQPGSLSRGRSMEEYQRRYAALCRVTAPYLWWPRRRTLRQTVQRVLRWHQSEMAAAHASTAP